MSSQKSIHDVLRQALTDAATALSIPLFGEGEVFTPPMTLHIVGHVVIERAAAASLGSKGFTHTDGTLVANCVTVAGKGDTEAVELALKVADAFPRGTSFEMAGGELVIMTPVAGQAASDGRRLTVPLKIPFYAITGAKS